MLWLQQNNEAIDWDLCEDIRTEVLTHNSAVYHSSRRPGYRVNTPIAAVHEPGGGT
jgi:hypothetical protein